MGHGDQQDQPDPARLGQLLPARRVQAHPRPPAVTSSNWRVIRWLRKRHRWRWKDSSAARFTTPSGRWLPSVGGRGRAVQPRLGNGHPLPIPGQQDPQPLHSGQPRLNGSDRGEPVASRGARRVRRAARGNGPAAMPTPRPVPTQPTHRPSGAAGPGRVQDCGSQGTGTSALPARSGNALGPVTPAGNGHSATRSRWWSRSSAGSRYRSRGTE